jgi:error-prone DNA polymerase
MNMSYSELHCHSYYSFHDGASSLEELMVRTKELGYHAIAITDHDNLCGVMSFAQLAGSLGMHGIIGAEVTLKGGFHLTLLAKDRRGYGNLCHLITAARASGKRNQPELLPELMPEHAIGLVALSGCPQGELARLIDQERFDEAKGLVRRYLEWFGSGNYYIELQHNFVYGATERNRRLAALAGETDVPVVATGNVHYHVQERHRLQDCLVAIRHNQSLEETHRKRRPNSEFYLRSINEMESLFEEFPDALTNTLRIAESCTFDLTTGLGYAFPDYAAPDGHTPESYLEKLLRLHHS